MYVSSKHRRHPNTTRILAVGFVLLYALASGRSLVPGMCATQAALAQNGDSFSPTICCARYPSGPEPDSDNGRTSHQREYPRCAFCQLALGISAPSSYAAVGEIEHHGSNRTIVEPRAIPSFAHQETNVGRDPPFVRAT